MTATTPLDAALERDLQPAGGRGQEPSRIASRSAGLDLLRVLACLLVVAFHLEGAMSVDFGPLSSVVRGGDAGIYIFFALSGYLLYRPFLRGPVDFPGYALRRSARIVPGYFVALICLSVLTRSPLAAHNPLPYLSMTATYNVELRGFLGNAWTLSAEILFYVLLPVIARYAAGREIPRLVIVGLVSIVLNFIYAPIYGPDTSWLSGALPFVLYAFIPGMILAVIEVRDPAVFRRVSSPWLALVGVGAIVLQTQLHGFPFAIPTGVGAALLIAWLSRVRIPFARAFAFSGGASYALYLWHKDLFLAFGPIGLPIALLGAAASWALVERPILELANSVARRLREPSPPPRIEAPVPVGAP